MAASRFGIWLERAMQEERVASQRQLGRLIGRTHATISRWMAGIHTPRPSDISKLASVLNRSHLEIYEALGLIPVVNPGLSQSKTRLIEKVLALDEDQLRIAEADIDYLLERQELLQTEAQTGTQDGESSQ